MPAKVYCSRTLVMEMPTEVWQQLRTRLCFSKIEIQETSPTMITFALNAIARLHNDESGQGLVEYLLVLALVALAATAGMSSLASTINSVFTQIGIDLGKYIAT